MFGFNKPNCYKSVMNVNLVQWLIWTPMKTINAKSYASKILYNRSRFKFESQLTCFLLLAWLCVKFLRLLLYKHYL